ncbi:MAG: GIY-YIG nuclease family protein [Candidatus Omnitrophica bacterium]|nr:GIY-YIG nuclease family protein [Candidatus Omnitrophota bacterium]
MGDLADLKLAIIDVETTGPSATGDRIIEIAIQRIEEGKIVRTFSSLVDPQQRIPSYIESLTGITNEDVAGAPTFRSIHEQMDSLLNGCIFVAHNVRFDYGFISNEYSRLGFSFSAPCVCTVRLSRRLYPQYRRHSLSDLIERFQLPCAQRHRALDDAQALWVFLQIAQQQCGADRFKKAIGALLKTPMLPPHLDASDLQRLPDAHGVYIFYDAVGQPLYVGKSRSVRARVLSHFSSDYASSRKMRFCQATARIESHATYGELGALLLESQLIKTLAPLYNRQLRSQRQLAIVRQLSGARRLRIWPYPSAVVLEEADLQHRAGHVFVIDNWRLVKALRYDEEGMAEFLPPQAGFDYDIYKILLAHLLRNGRSVKPFRPC